MINFIAPLCCSGSKLTIIVATSTSAVIHPFSEPLYKPPTLIVLSIPHSLRLLRSQRKMTTTFLSNEPSSKGDGRPIYRPDLFDIIDSTIEALGDELRELSLDIHGKLDVAS